MKKSVIQTAVLVFALVFSTATLALAQDSQTKVKKESIKPMSTTSGEQMYKAYCAVCHGTTGKGDGPAAAEFKTPPSNLTLLAQTHNGKYPDAYVTQVIQTGPQNAKAHGSKDMPVWGTTFSAIDNSTTKGESTQRIYNLNKYIESLQAK